MGEEVDFFPCFGEDDIVVTVVVAVRGRSRVALDTAAADELGSCPVSSSLRILDLRSSNSSQTVEGAVVESVDSVPSVGRGSRSTMLLVSCPETMRLFLTAERFELR